MKLSSFAATIAISLLSTTEGLQSNLRSVVPDSISTAASSSSTTDVSLRGTTRSAAASAATPSNDIQRHAQAVDDRYYYPSWNTGEHTCKNDGNAPNYMKTDSGYHESTLKDCCEQYYSYDMHTCMGNNPIDIEGFYPAWADANEIKCMSATDTLPPAYMLNNPTAWIDSDIATCCSRRYGWATAACISASLEAAGSSTPASSPATTACVGECYTFDSQEGKMTVTTPVNGGCNSDAMCVMTLESITNPTPPAGSVTVPTGSPTIDELSTPTPSHSPSRSPSKEPTQGPSVSPSTSPTSTPTSTPSQSPSKSPSKGPSMSPSTSPTPLPCPADETLAVGATCSASCPNSCGVGLGCKNSQCLTIDWIQLGGDLDGEAATDYSGHSVSLSSDGNTVAIGAHLNDGETGVVTDDRGHVRVYKRDESNQPLGWTQVGNDIDGEAAGDQFGFSLSLSDDGKILAIGAPKHKGEGLSYAEGVNAGHVRVYRLNNDESDWIKLGDIDGEDGYNESGYAVSLSSDGKTLAIGAPYNRGADTNAINSWNGHVRVYQLKDDESDWEKLGNDIDGANDGDQGVLGWSVSLSSDGRTVAAGAPYSTKNGAGLTGHVLVYKFDDVTSDWVKIGNGNGSTSGKVGVGVAGEDYSGWAVSLSADGKSVAISAYGNDGNGSKSGHVRVYKVDDSDNWVQLGLDINGEAAGDLSGWSVSLSADGKIVAIGAKVNAGVNGGQSGHVRIYGYDGSGWVKLGEDIDGEYAGMQSGYSVSLSDDGETVAIGSRFNSDNGGCSGSVRVYEVAT